MYTETIINIPENLLTRIKQFHQYRMYAHTYTDNVLKHVHIHIIYQTAAFVVEVDDYVQIYLLSYLQQNQHELYSCHVWLIGQKLCLAEVQCFGACFLLFFFLWLRTEDTISLNCTLLDKNSAPNGTWGRKHLHV